LRDNKITHAGATALLNIKHPKFTPIISISGNNLGDEFAKQVQIYLEKTKSINIKSLDITNTHISENMQNELKLSLEKCTLVSNGFELIYKEEEEEEDEAE